MHGLPQLFSNGRCISRRKEKVEDLLEVCELEHSNTSCKKGYHTVTCPLLLRSIDHAESNVRLQTPSPKPSKKMEHPYSILLNAAFW